MCHIKQLNQILKELDNLLSDEAKNINKYIKGEKKEYKSNIFDLISNNINIQNQQNPEKNSSPGIYIFKVANNTKLSYEFNNVQYAAKINNNINSDLSISKDDFLYLGKAENSLCSRLDEHLTKCKKKTYSLKLFDKNRQSLFNNISLYTFALKKEFQNYKKIILSTVESELHKLLRPIVGSSRT